MQRKKLDFFIFSMVCLYTCLNLTSCKKDDDSLTSIIGVWNCYEIIDDEGTWVGEDIDYPYMIIGETYLGFNDYPLMPSKQTGGEKYVYTYNANSKTLTLRDYDMWDDEIDDFSFEMKLTTLTSSELIFEWDVNGYPETFKFKRYK